MKIKIIDYIGNSFNNIPIGHPKKVIEQFYNILSDDFDVELVLPEIYMDDFEIDLKVPYYQKIENNKSILKKLYSTFKKFLNIVDVVKSTEDELLFFVNIDITLFVSLIFVSRTKKIAIVNYTNYESNTGNIKSLVKKYIYRIVKDKILLEFSTFNVMSDKFIPDYYFISNDQKPERSPEVDLLVIGTINEAKDVISLIQNTVNTNLALRVVGKFYDENYYEEVLKCSYNASNITILNKYLSEEEYRDEISRTKYVVLPYRMDIYNNLTSGVFLDAIYNNKPIICPKTPFFEQFIDSNIGIIYSKMNDLEGLIELHSYNESLINIEELQKRYSESIVKERVISSILKTIQTVRGEL